MSDTNPEEEHRQEMSEVNSPSRSKSLIQSMLQRLSDAEHNDPYHKRPNTPPYRCRAASGETDAADILRAEVVAVTEEDDNSNDVQQSEVPTETHEDLKSPSMESEESDEGNSGIHILHAVLETPVVGEETSIPPAVIPRWERKVFKPCPLVLDTRRPPPPIPSKKKILPTPPVLNTRSPPPPVYPKKPFLPTPPVLDTRPLPPPIPSKKKILPTPPVLNTRSPPPPVYPKKMFLPSPPVLDIRTPPTPKSCKRSFLHSSPVQDPRTPTPPKSPKTRFLPRLPVQKEDVLLSPRDSLFMNSVITKSQCQFLQPLLDPPPTCTSQGSEVVQKMEPTGSIMEQDLIEPRGKVLGSLPKASMPEEKGLMGEPKLLSKPPSRNKHLSLGLEGRSKDSLNGSTSSGPETREISPDLLPVPLPRSRFLTPIVDKENSGVESVLSDRDKDQINVEVGGLLQPVRNEGGAEEAVIQDTVLRSKHPNMNMKADKVTKSARKIIDRWKENIRKERGKEEIRGEDVEKETENKLHSVNLHRGQNSVRLQAQMTAIEEEEGGKDEEEDSNEEDDNDEEDQEGEDQEGEEFSSVTCMQQSPMSEQPSQAESFRRQGSIISSFKFNFSPVSLMDEILTGEEWAPFLSPNSRRCSSPSVDQSERTSQHGYNDNSQIKNEPELGSLNNVEQNLMDTDISVYEEVIVNLSDKTVENQYDAAQKKVKCNDNGVKAILESETLLDYGAAGRSKLDRSRAKSSNGSNYSVEPIRNQPLDLSCVKSHEVLDSSAQKHRIELNKKRKHRVPKLKKGFFRIGRTTIGAPDIQVKQSSPNSSAASSTPCDIFPTSVFYSIPPSIEQQDTVGSPTQGNLPIKSSDVHSSIVNVSSPRSNVITALRNWAKRKPL
ncbi:bromodomain-containing protein 4 [Esox lucius]|uniref:bromodomain-containing protein 4 n=1 Tax=Esox lucius TaxID=8010 RepID=UPI001476DD42|nr:bromodomain-containing protein 4 [Esox lucius]